MGKVDGNEYIERYIEDLKNINDKRKARFFLTCLKEDMGGEVLDDLTIFSTVGKEYLLECFERYVNESPSKQAAGDYRRTILNICKKICEDFGLENDFLKSAIEIRDFDETVKEWIDLLEEPRSRECMSFEDYESLDSEIRCLFEHEDLENQVIKSIEIRNYKPNYYGRLVSAIALKLIQKYGLDNKTISNLKIDDLKLAEGVILASGFELPINGELLSYIELYLKFRNLVVSKEKSVTDFLFIKKNATPYLDKNGRPDCGRLFLLMDSALHHTTTTSLRYRTIINLVSKGANINLLSQLTGVTSGTIVEICPDDKKNLEKLIGGTSTVNSWGKKSVIKGYIRCPFCGNYKDAGSENWILIQVNGEDRKYIACRECRGLDGKYRY